MLSNIKIPRESKTMADEAPKTKWTLQERWEHAVRHNGGYWHFPRGLFGNAVDIHDLTERDYQQFLDNVRSLDDLIQGLSELSPFADDALFMAERMRPEDFPHFKLALAHERRVAEYERRGIECIQRYEMPKRFLTIVIPRKFVLAGPMAETCDVCLGVALIQMEQEEMKEAG